MLVIGIVGGIASGKSIVAQRLAELGAIVLNADRIGHEVLQQPDIVAALRQRWGERVVDAQGHIRRAAVAEIVFGNDEKHVQERKFLESQTHPHIRRRLLEAIDQARRAGYAATVVDAPVLLEAGWHEICDVILFVDTPRAQRLERAVQHRGWSEQQFAAREAAQWPTEKKRQHADLAIDNSATLDATRRQVDAWWQRTIGTLTTPSPQ